MIGGSCSTTWPSRQVKAGNALSEGAEQVRARGIGNFCNVRHGLRRDAVSAVDRGDVAYARRSNSRDVGGGEVHRNRANDGSDLAANDDASFVGKHAHEAVRISRG